jgi:hypothetical protein
LLRHHLNQATSFGLYGIDRWKRITPWADEDGTRFARPLAQFLAHLLGGVRLQAHCISIPCLEHAKAAAVNAAFEMLHRQDVWLMGERTGL